jgi:hypothetical protein
MITAETFVDVRDEPRHRVCFENDLVRTYWIDLPRGEATLFHRHEHPYAGICVSQSFIRNEVVGDCSTELRMQSGDVMYTPGQMTHRIENIGESAFQNITIEVLRSVGHTSSSLKRLERERRQVEMVIDERALRVANLELAAGERCDLVGDHLVIWLQGVATASTFAESKSLSRVGDFAWCCGVATVESFDGAKVAIVEVT